MYRVLRHALWSGSGAESGDGVGWWILWIIAPEVSDVVSWPGHWTPQETMIINF